MDGTAGNKVLELIAFFSATFSGFPGGEHSPPQTIPRVQGAPRQ